MGDGGSRSDAKQSWKLLAAILGEENPLAQRSEVIKGVSASALAPGAVDAGPRHPPCGLVS